MTGFAGSLWKTARMRVSAKADYALRALIEMAARVDGPQARPVSAEELGRLQEIPHNFLQAILADLRKAGVVHAQRGQSGGWRLAKDAESVSVADVIRAVDGPLLGARGRRPGGGPNKGRPAAGRGVGRAPRHSLRDVFEQVSVADLASGKLPNAITRLTEDEDAWQ